MDSDEVGTKVVERRHRFGPIPLHDPLMSSLVGALPVLSSVFLLSINLWLIGRLGRFVTDNPVSLLLIMSSLLLGLFMLIYAFAVTRYEKSKIDTGRREYVRQVEDYVQATYEYEKKLADVADLLRKRLESSG